MRAPEVSVREVRWREAEGRVQPLNHRLEEPLKCSVRLLVTGDETAHAHRTDVMHSRLYEPAQ
eukprot:COSAG03_NODE_3568_length_1946_cov_1.520845_4_plen_62_part_01